LVRDPPDGLFQTVTFLTYRRAVEVADPYTEEADSPGPWDGRLPVLAVCRRHRPGGKRGDGCSASFGQAVRYAVSSAAWGESRLLAELVAIHVSLSVSCGICERCCLSSPLPSQRPFCKLGAELLGWAVQRARRPREHRLTELFSASGEEWSVQHPKAGG